MKTASMAVSLVDKMGSDLSIVNAARVSFDKRSITLTDADIKLLRYLATHKHWSPFAHTSLQFRIKAPIFVARQLVKHQVGGVWNEVSRRYVNTEPELYFPRVFRNKPAGSIKQGSGDTHKESDLWIEACRADLSKALRLYKEMIKSDIAPEQARMVLPQNTMTEWIWTGSLYFFHRVCSLRMEDTAQQETKMIAEIIAEHCGVNFPHAWAALWGCGNGE